MLYAIGLALLGLIEAPNALKTFESTNFILVDREIGTMKWAKGQRYCQNKFGTDLATVNSQERQEELADLMRSNGYTTDKQKAWLGGKDKREGKWRWMDGSDWGYTHWNVGEPNNAGGSEDCLMTWPHASYRWNDGVCSRTTICPLFVCNRPCDCDGRGNPCNALNWAVKKAGLFWAWASPCSGRCSQAELKFGWRYATPEEWKNHPTKAEFMRDLPESEWCAAKIFDPKYDHCDEGNNLVPYPDDGYNEQVLVHDDCGGLAPPPPKDEKCDCGLGQTCHALSWAVPKAGYYWAWASPCSGGCSQVELKNGWRFPTKEEWRYHPTKKEFRRGLPSSEWCAASFFDPKYDHCDVVNPLVPYPDGSYNEQVLIHDDCENPDREEPPENPCACGPDGKPCDVLDWAVEKGGLFWAWSSPCSGGCSQINLKYGWRYATEEEWKNHPTKEEFYRDLPESEWCAAKIFDPKWDHCDQVNPLVRVNDGSYNELVLVHDKCGGCLCSENTLCKDTPFAHRDPETGFFWAWASPCSGGCSKLVDPLPFGWRRATDEEWKARSWSCNEHGLKFFGYDDSMGQPVQSGAHPDVCAANVFDPKYNHCDSIDFKNGYVAHKENGNNHETVLIHDFDPAICGNLENFNMPFPIIDKDLDADPSDTLV